MDLVAGFLQRTVAAVDRARLYADPDLAPARHPGEISAEALARMRAIVTAAAFVGRADFVRFAGAHLTEPRADTPRRTRAPDRATLTRALGQGAALTRRPGARMAFAREGARTLLFADGRHWPVPQGLGGLVRALTAARRVAPERLRPHLRRAGAVSLLAALIAAGVLRLEGSAAGRAAGGRARRGSRRAAGSRGRGGRR
jgi:ribosomal protein L16 Arg81 hydroxylase